MSVRVLGVSPMYVFRSLSSSQNQNSNFTTHTDQLVFWGYQKIHNEGFFFLIGILLITPATVSIAINVPALLLLCFCFLCHRWACWVTSVRGSVLEHLSVLPQLLAELVWSGSSWHVWVLSFIFCLDQYTYGSLFFTGGFQIQRSVDVFFFLQSWLSGHQACRGLVLWWWERSQLSQPAPSYQENHRFTF